MANVEKLQECRKDSQASRTQLHENPCMELSASMYCIAIEAVDLESATQLDLLFMKKAMSMLAVFSNIYMYMVNPGEGKKGYGHNLNFLKYHCHFHHTFLQITFSAVKHLQMKYQWI